METKKFYISASGDWGECMVSYDNEPTWDLDSAMMFDTKGEASLWILNHGKEWVDDELKICDFDEVE